MSQLLSAFVHIYLYVCVCVFMIAMRRRSSAGRASTISEFSSATNNNDGYSMPTKKVPASTPQSGQQISSLLLNICSDKIKTFYKSFSALTPFTLRVNNNNNIERKEENEKKNNLIISESHWNMYYLSSSLLFANSREHRTPNTRPHFMYGITICFGNIFIGWYLCLRSFSRRRPSNWFVIEFLSLLDPISHAERNHFNERQRRKYTIFY